MGNLGKLIGAVVAVGGAVAGGVALGAKAIKNKIEKNAEPKPVSNDNTQRASSFCSNCGAKLNDGAKFCSGCGTSVGGAVMQIPPSIPSENNVTALSYNGRQQEYVGKVFKCSNCGGAITQTTAICPECGMRITGQSAVGSVQELSCKLMEIEKEKSKGIFGISGKNAKSQTLLLLKTFPIPNTIDDILEFMFLANANIDVNLSKKGFWGNSSTEAAEVSNAWVAKMQQAYQKAEIICANDPAFKQIQKIYLDKMKELKIKV